MKRKKITINNEKISINETYGDQANIGNIAKDIAATGKVFINSLKRGFYLSEYLVKLGVTIAKGESIHDLNKKYGDIQRGLSREANSIIDGMSGSKDTKIFMSLAVPSSTLLRMSVENGPTLSSGLGILTTGSKKRWNGVLKTIYKGNPPKLLMLDTGMSRDDDTSTVKSSLSVFIKFLYIFTGENIKIAKYKNNSQKDNNEIVRVSKILNTRFKDKKFLNAFEDFHDKIMSNNKLNLSSDYLSIYTLYYKLIKNKDIDTRNLFKSSSEYNLNEFSNLITVLKRSLIVLSKENPDTFSSLENKLFLNETRKIIFKDKKIILEEKDDDSDDSKDEETQPESDKDKEVFEQINDSIRSAYMIPKFVLCYTGVQSNNVHITLSAIIPRVYEKMLYFLEELAENVENEIETNFDVNELKDFTNLFESVLDANEDNIDYLNKFISANIKKDFIDDSIIKDADASENIENIKKALEKLAADMIEKTNEINQTISAQKGKNESYKIEIYQSLIQLIEKSKPMFEINIENKYNEYLKLIQDLDVENSIKFIEGKSSWYKKLDKKFKDAAYFVSSDKITKIKNSGNTLNRVNNEIKKINLKSKAEKLFNNLNELIKDLTGETEDEDEDKETDSELVDDNEK